MELQEAIENRRSIRRFKPDKVENSLIKQLFNAARLAPSSKNRQPWMFYIARKDVKQNIVKIMKTWYENNKNEKTSVLGTAMVIEQAPVLILVFRNADNKLERSDTLSIGAAIEHILLKATELNLGSLWIADTAYVNDEISKLVNTNLELFSAIAIGYADETPAARPRKKLKEITFN